MKMMITFLTWKEIIMAKYIWALLLSILMEEIALTSLYLMKV
jgi:hypothetical protein